MDHRGGAEKIHRTSTRPTKAQKTPQTSWIKAGNWTSSFALFVYAAFFSLVYNTLSAGTGALLLFGAVQAAMILWGLRKGEQLDAVQIAGLVVAMTGLIVNFCYPVFPRRR